MLLAFCNVVHPMAKQLKKLSIEPLKALKISGGGALSPDDFEEVKGTTRRRKDALDSPTLARSPAAKAASTTAVLQTSAGRESDSAQNSDAEECEKSPTIARRAVKREKMLSSRAFSDKSIGKISEGMQDSERKQEIPEGVSAKRLMYENTILQEREEKYKRMIQDEKVFHSSKLSIFCDSM